jgi:hypothetical protein
MAWDITGTEICKILLSEVITVEVVARYELKFVEFC